MLYKAIIRQALFALSRDDAEEAHLLMLRAAEKIQGNPRLLRYIAWWYQANRNPSPATVAGISFPNRVGLAAGFDKEGQMLPLIQALGFGFGEVGTVLPHPQKGNERPRLFRISKERAIINRMGFNSGGMCSVSCNLRQHTPGVSMPIGISLGKMKETPNEEAVQDYIKVWHWLRGYAAYGVGNISSPNTPGLRELQGGKYIEQFVRDLVQAERELAAAAGENPRPIFIKLAPDLSDEELDDSIGACENGGASGLICGNTTLKRPLVKNDTETARQTGGMSGSPLFYTALSKFCRARKLTKLPMIFVGGLDSGDRIKKALGEGADLVQLYSGLIYEGPKLVSKARAAAEAYQKAA